MIELPFFPTEASTVAGQVDLLLVALLALGVFFTIIIMALIVYFGIKYRRGKQADRSNPPLGNTKMELGWVFGLLVLSAGAFVWATVIYFHMSTPPQDTMDIFVVGKQWMWKFQHQEGQREINVLHVPLGRPVRLIMTSEDVIHSFYVPAFRLKRDVLPGRYTYLWFQATKTGEFHLFCAEYCGTDHAKMTGTVIVMEPRQFQDWLGGTQTVVSLSQAGEQLFQQFGCTSCHTAGAAVLAPSLDGLFGSTVSLSDGGSVVADENYIRESLFFPQKKIVAGFDPIMPSYEGRLTEEQVLDLIAYIKSLGSSANPTPTPSQ
jgi:cytochrome c oxidase subunit 2